MDLFFFKKK